MRLTARGRRGRARKVHTAGGRRRGQGAEGQETPTLRGTNTSPRRVLQEPVLRSPAVRPPPPGGPP